MLTKKRIQGIMNTENKTREDLKMTVMIEFFGELIPAEDFWTDEPFGEGWEEDYDSFFEEGDEEE